MGRKKIYESEQKRYDAEKRRKREWYRRNSDKIKKSRMDDYWKSKNVESKLPVL